MRKKILYNIAILGVLALGGLTISSCHKDLLDRVPAGELAASEFWKSTDDAEYIINGVYSQTRGIFDRDYSWDGYTEFLRYTNSVSKSTLIGGVAYAGSTYYEPNNQYGGAHNNYYKYCYAAVNRANFAIENISKMLDYSSESIKPQLVEYIAEARMLRAMTYFRMISLWGDVIYYEFSPKSDDDVTSLARTPIAEIYQHIYDDFTYAYENLPDTPVARGRFTKWGALGLRGKLQLFWACWNRTSWPWETPTAPNGGWPELDTFTPSQSASDEAYIGAAKDFRTVIEDSGLTLFRDGEPGDWGTMGDCETLPNYYYLFIPTANDDGELMVTFTHGGTGTGQGDELMRWFGTRATENSQGLCNIRTEIINRYQSTITGDFCDPVVYINPNRNSDARTTLNCAVNPQTYANRDYRMKATMLWDRESMVALRSLALNGIAAFEYGHYSGTVTASNGVSYPAINCDNGRRTGLIPRKFVRNYAAGGRNQGDYSWPVLRLADVYLMYAEAANEAYGPTGDGGLAIELVNKIRHRGNLPALKPSKYSDKETFFYAIEQERIVELFAEGERFFDLRRWRSIERCFGAPQTLPGYITRDTWGSVQNHLYANTPIVTYQRQYIFRIPESERERNPKLTQNPCWM